MSSTILKTANTFLNCFETLDADTMYSIRTPDCVQVFAPASLDPPPPKDRTAFRDHINGLKAVLIGFPVKAKEIFENEAKKEVVIWATSLTIFRDEVKDENIPEEEWSYRGEYIFILKMDESGEKITRVVEFLDSKNTERLRGLMEKARAKCQLESKLF